MKYLERVWLMLLHVLIHRHYFLGNEQQLVPQHLC